MTRSSILPFAGSRTFPPALVPVLLGLLLAAPAAAQERLEFVVQPSDTEVNQVISPAIQVRAVNDNDETDEDFDDEIRIRIEEDPTGVATLNGDTRVDAIDGVATFDDLSIDRVGSGFTLRVMSPGGIDDDFSESFEITPAATGPPSGATSEITASPTSIPADGSSTSTITVQLRDAEGDNLTTGGDNVTLSTTAGTLSAVNDNGDGTYTATLTSSTSPATATVTGTVGGNAISDDATVTFTATGPGPPSGAASEITASPTSIPANGASTSTITVQLRDADGDDLGSGGHTVTLSTTAGTLSAVNDNGDGTYTATLTSSTTPESATVTGTVDGGAISDDATVTFTAQEPSGATSTISASPSSIPADGSSTSTITVQLKDAGGTNLTTGGDGVTLSTTAGTLSAVTDNGDGTYTATLRSSSTPETATVTGTVNGEAISDDATVTFTVLPASRLEFRVQPSTTPAGQPISPTVEVRAVNVLGLTDVTFNRSVTLAIGANPGGGALSGTTSRTASNGIATFPGISIDNVGAGYTLTASASGVAGDTSDSFSIVPGAAARLEFDQQPGATAAGSVIDPPVTVRVEDANGNLATGFTGNVTVILGSNPGSGSLSGTTTRSVSGGIATFDDLSIDRPGSGYTLIATSGALTDATSDPFDVTTGTPNRLVFQQQPTDDAAGETIAPPVTVRVVDGSGNTVTGFGGAVTLSLATNPGGGTLSGTTSVNASSGVATFSDLSIDRAGSGYSLRASGGSLSPATSVAFSITPGPAAGANSTIEASPAAIPADGSSTATVTVRLADAFGNPLVSGGDAVTLSTTAGSLGPVSDNGDGTYTATLTAASTAASATITGTVNGDTIDDTATVVFSAGGAAALEFQQEPTETVAGETISPAPTVRVVDVNGNTVTTFTGSITVSIGDNPGGGVLAGTTTRSASGGVATFDDLSIDAAADGYTLDASATGLAGATSAGFDIVPGGADAAVSTIEAAPTSIPADGSSTATITVRLTDALGNPLASGGDAVTLTATAGSLGPVSDNGDGTYSATLTSGPTATTATISGTVNGDPIADTATVTFTATGSGALQLVFEVQPSDTPVGETIAPSVEVRVVDETGATATDFSGSVSVRIGTNPAGGTLTGTTTSDATGGVATFGDLALDRTGAGYTLIASSADVASATSAPFRIDAGAASGASSVITADPTTIPADGASISAITVRLRDAAGNDVVRGGDRVTLSTTAGTLGPVRDNGNGLYTASLTSSTTVTTATVSGTVNGAAITDTAPVAFASPATLGTDLAVTVSVSDPAPAPGQTIVYTLTVTNGGPGDADDVQVSDDMPDRLAFVSSDASQGSYDAGTGVWTVGSLANGAQATLRITVRVN